MKRRKSQAGFTLLELIIAASLSTIVMIGVFSLMANMVQSEVDGMRNGTVSAWTLANINAMNTEIAGSSYISVPSPGASGDSLVVCTNWSATALGPATPGVVYKLANAPVNGTNAVNAVYYYCYDTTDPAPWKNAILRKVVANPAGGAGACPAAAPICSIGNYSGDAIVATGVYRLDALSTNTQPVFTADSNNVKNAVRLRFIVGNPKAGVSAGSNAQTSSSVPQTISFDTKILMED